MIVSTNFRWRHVGTKLRSRLRIAGLINGCGPKGGWLAWIIPACILGLCVDEFCDWHDLNYVVGGKEADRIKADWQFHEVTREQAIALTSSLWRRGLRPLYLFVAWSLYQAVRLCGRRYFYYGEARSEEDVMRLLRSIEDAT